jgi:hypothetical protein
MGFDVALYLVIHTPRDDDEGTPRPPTRLRELATDSLSSSSGPKWLRAWSPDLHDDRIFTLWDAEDANFIRAALEDFGFLNEMDAQPMRVREWGPNDVMSAGE